MSTHPKCECGKRTRGEFHVWNGMHHLSVCEECWRDPENIILEACVEFANDFTGDSLEECLRIQLGFREIAYTQSIQALCDRRYCEWYLEERSATG